MELKFNLIFDIETNYSTIKTYVMLHTMTLLAKVLDNETILENIKEGITEWQITKDEETFVRIIINCHLLFIKRVTEGKNMNEFIADVENVGKFMEMFNAKN